MNCSIDGVAFAPYLSLASRCEEGMTVSASSTSMCRGALTRVHDSNNATRALSQFSSRRRGVRDHAPGLPSVRHSLISFCCVPQRLAKDCGPTIDGSIGHLAVPCSVAERGGPRTRHSRTVQPLDGSINSKNTKEAAA